MIIEEQNSKLKLSNQNLIIVNESLKNN